MNFHRRRSDKLEPLLPHLHDASEPCSGGCEDILVVEENACKLKQDISTLEGRIKEGHDQMTGLKTRLDEGDARMGRMEVTLSANTSKLDHNSAETSEILSIMREGEAFFRIAKRMGELLKWLLAIATAIAAFWLTVKGWPVK